MEHMLGCYPEYFDAIARGDKNFEVRWDDRGFQKGDILVLCRNFEDHFCRHLIEYCDGKPKDLLRRRITYILTGGQFGIVTGYSVLGLGPEEEENG